MARFTVKHNRAIWETTTFEVNVPDPLPEEYEDPVDFVRDHLDKLMADAIETDAATIEQGDQVESMDSDIEILDAAGNQVYSDLHDEEGG
jgi:hypothetical protein